MDESPFFSAKAHFSSLTLKNFTPVKQDNAKECRIPIQRDEKQGMRITMQLKKLGDKAIDQLFDAILTLKDIEECYVFFDDLCTVNEIQSLSQRLEVARMLRKGNTYNQIEAETGASTATISRVKRCLNYGNDGYKMSLERLGR
jgi:TrpR-related protein YerC/YecD